MFFAFIFFSYQYDAEYETVQTFPKSRAKRRGKEENGDRKQADPSFFVPDHLNRSSPPLSGKYPTLAKISPEQTGVHSGENCSSLGGKLQFGVEKTFRNSACFSV